MIQSTKITIEDRWRTRAKVHDTLTHVSHWLSWSACTRRRRTHMDQLRLHGCGAAWRRGAKWICGLASPDRRMRSVFTANQGADGLRADHFYLTRSSTDWLGCNGAGMLSLSSGQLPRSPYRRDTIFEGIVTGDPTFARESGKFSGWNEPTVLNVHRRFTSKHEPRDFRRRFGRFGLKGSSMS